MSPQQICPLQLNVLGDFKVSHAGQVITTISGTRQQALLTFMALHYGAPQTRQHVAFQLWPDSSESQAKHNLRKALYHLRHTFSAIEHYWQIDARTISWRAETPCTVDVVEFEQKLAQADTLAADAAAQQVCLTEAVALYGGDLLPTCYDDWITPERERLHHLYQKALVQAAQLAERRRDYSAAIHHANELLRLDPLHEAAYGRVMRLHMLNQDRAAALQIYQRCVIRLQQELGVPPSMELQKMHGELRQTERLLSTRPLAQRAEQQLVGRQAEWQALTMAWQQATRSQVHLCLLNGEAGIGKTYLAEEMLAWAAQQGFITATAHLFEAAASLVYTPLVDWLREPALHATVLQMDKIWLGPLARLLPEIAVAHPELSLPAATSEQWQRRWLFDALARVFRQGDRPKILLIDDLQWCDGETLAWLRYLLSFARSDQTVDHSNQPLLILATVRHEDLDADHPLTQWLIELHSAHQMSEIALAPLDPVATGELAAQVAHTSIDAKQVDAIHHVTHGNPLFVVEMIRAGMDLDGDDATEVTGPLPFPLDPAHATATRLPPKVQAVIQRRLGRLSAPALHAANVAATVGRAFSFTLLRHASGQSEATLTSALDELWRRGIIRLQGLQHYDFSHARIREVLYAELSPIQKPLLHRQLAQTLQTVYADNLAPVSVQIAAHYERAGAMTEAIAHYRQAADASHALFADKEAVALLKRALALLETFPTTRISKQQELAILLQLSRSLANAYGFLTPEVPLTSERARQLAIEVGTSTQLYHALGGLKLANHMRGQFAQAQAIAEEMHTLASQRSDIDPSTPTADLDHQLGLINWLQGQLRPARTFFDQAIAKDKTTPLTRSFSAFTFWLLGYPDRARSEAYCGLQSASQLGNPFVLSGVTVNLARFNYFVGRPIQMRLWAQRAVAWAEACENPFWLSIGKLFLGYALAQGGESDAGIALAERAMANRREEEQAAFRTHFECILAQTYGVAQRYAEALATIDKGLALADQTGEDHWRAELIRVRGDFLFQQKGSQTAAASCYEEAIAIAQEQEAKSLALRATMSLCELPQEQAQRTVNRQRLAALYNGFDEGFRMPDLRKARSLLAL